MFKVLFNLKLLFKPDTTKIIMTVPPFVLLSLFFLPFKITSPKKNLIQPSNSKQDFVLICLLIYES